jgi:hypothetical protein
MDSLPSLESLAGLLRGGVDMRPTLLRVLTDLYVQKLAHSADEDRHYTELALRLLDAVDLPTRVSVARRLARHLSPPAPVIKRLAADLPDVAEPVREHLLRQQAAPAAAGARPAQSNPEPTVSARAADAARQDSQRESEPVHRDAPPPNVPNALAADVASELNEMFLAADARERRIILLNIEIVAPIPAGMAAIDRDVAVAQRLESAALARHGENLAQELARALHITGAQARRIVSDNLGEPIVAAAKALNMPRDAVYRMLLFINSAIGHSVARMHALAALYDEMPMQAAEHMVAIWQALNGNERAASKYRPLYWNDEARARARSASVAVRRAPSTQRTIARRDAS